jgi:hypothetical protein
VAKRLDTVEETWHEMNVMHEVSLREPEEDDYLLLHIWSALTIGMSAGLLSEAIPYVSFDTTMPRSDRLRIMAFYRRCVQRHLHAGRGGPDRQYLAKNPALTPKLETVFELFPDARVIYLVRNPLEVIPSFLSMMEFSWRAVGVPVEGTELRDFLLAMARRWYSDPLEVLDRTPPDRHAIINYEDLVSDPEQTVCGIYDRFGFALDDGYASVLRQHSARARQYRSRHDYDLDELGLSREEIMTEFREVFERFGFATGEGEEGVRPASTPIP